MMDLSASRPTLFMSSPWPAMPTTSVPKMIGTMIDLIIRRKTVDSGFSVTAKSGNAQPTSTPIAIAIRIHCVREKRRRMRSIIALKGRCGDEPVSLFADGRRWNQRNRRRPATERGVAVAVCKIEDESYHQPPSEAHPRQRRQPLHHEYAEQRADDSHHVHEGNAERPRPRRIGVTQHYHSDADKRKGEQRADVREIVRLSGI